MTLASLIEKIDYELEELEQIYNAISTRITKDSKQEVKWKKTDDPEALRGYIALSLQNYYGCVENILKKVDNTIDKIGYGGEQWHKDLLRRMSQSTSYRSNIIEDQFYDWLDDLRAFRHIVMHLYTHNLKESRLKEQVLNAITHHKPFTLSIKKWAEPIRNELVK